MFDLMAADTSSFQSPEVEGSLRVSHAAFHTGSSKLNCRKYWVFLGRQPLTPLVKLQDNGSLFGMRTRPVTNNDLFNRHVRNTYIEHTRVDNYHHYFKPASASQLPYFLVNNYFVEVSSTESHSSRYCTVRLHQVVRYVKCSSITVHEDMKTHNIPSEYHLLHRDINC